jgi:hypothetical protein
VEKTGQLRTALATLVASVEEVASPQLRIAVDAYVDQVERLLTLADEAAAAGKNLDAESLIISAQRWLWKIAKSCALTSGATR